MTKKAWHKRAKRIQWRIKSLKRANAILSATCDEHLKRARRWERAYKTSSIEDMCKEINALLAWQRGVRDARREDCNFTPSDTVEVSQEWLDRLTRAIEAEPKGET